MGNDRKRVVIASTFSAEFLEPSLRYYNVNLGMNLAFDFAPYDQVYRELLSPGSLMARNTGGLNVVLVRVADWMRRKTEGDGIAGDSKYASGFYESLESAYGTFSHAISSFVSTHPCQVFILVCPSEGAGSDPDIERAFDEYAARMLKDAKRLPSVYCMDAREYHRAYGVKTVYDPVGDAMGHIPYRAEYVHLLGTLVARYCYGVFGKPKKVIVTDCDNTIWNGVCGEAGPGGIDASGVPGMLQGFLAGLHDKGFLLALASRNNESDVWAVFDSRDDMPLKRRNIVAAKIDWELKSKNIAELGSELNLSTDSMIFIDDSDIECAEVKANCPGVTVIKWPLPVEDPVRTLSGMWFFDRFSVTEEDAERTNLYRTDAARRKAAGNASDWIRFVKELGLDVAFEPLSADSLERASQLTQRTNQFNFSTERMTPGELTRFIDESNPRAFTLRVKDRFGSYGTAGLVIIDSDPERLHVTTLLLSCRVLGRGVEHRVIARIASMALESGKKAVRLHFTDTDKNKPARIFMDRLVRTYGGAWISGSYAEFDPEKLAGCTMDTDPCAMPADPGTPDAPKQSEDYVPETTADPVKLWLSASDATSISLEIESFDKALHEKPRTPDSPGKADDPVKTIARIVSRYTAYDPGLFSSDLPIERLSLESRDIVSITSELSFAFGDVSHTLFFENRTFGDLCDAVTNTRQGKGRARDARARRAYGCRTNTTGESIAITGVSCRYPGARNVYEFWENLKAGKSSIGEVPPDRWNASEFYSGDESDSFKSYSRWGGFIEGADRFDAAFFGITPRQAELMDPQARLFLEVVWNLLEDAGYDPEKFEKRTGVFAGVISSDYGLYQNWLSLGRVATFRNCDLYQIANRISYFFDFRGPSMAIDTACSASGTALHVACESILSGSCKAAVVGGINLILHPSRFVQYSHAGMLSRDSGIRPFGDCATGTIMGEGVGALLLKPYSAALADRDNIWGVIRGSAVNSGGRTTGFTVPNPDAQCDAVLEALEKGATDPDTITCIETHGTGTPLGDPIEIAGLEQALMSGKPEALRPCAIGSVKSNIGHLESGAAVAGIIKVLLQMRFRTLVPSLNAENPNPKIDFSKSRFKVQTTLSPWTAENRTTGESIPLVAGVSSFGAGGSNSHVIIGEPPAAKDERKVSDNGEPELVFLSAGNEELLATYAANLAAFLGTRASANRESDDYTLRNVAFTLRSGRKHMNARLAIIARSLDDLAGMLESFSRAPRSCDRTGTVTGCIDSKSALAELVKGDAGEAYQERLAAAKDLRTLAKFWVNGGEIAEGILDSGRDCSRVSLPAYPFNGKRYWMESCPDLDRAVSSGFGYECPAKPREESGGTAATLKPDSTGQYELYARRWEKSGAEADHGCELPGDSIIFCGDPKPSNAVLRFMHKLTPLDGRITIVSERKGRIRKVHAYDDIESVAVPRLDANSCGRVIRRLAEAGRNIANVVYLADFANGAEKRNRHIFDVLFSISRELLLARGLQAVRVTFAYPGSRERVNPYLSAVAGFARTVRAENPNIDFRTLRIDARGAASGNAGSPDIAYAVYNELSMVKNEPEVCYENGERFVMRFARMEPESILPCLRAAVPEQGESYLVTGGLGSLGYAIAAELANAKRCTVILADAKPLDALSMDRIRLLKATGSTIHYIEANLAKARDARRIVRIIRRYIGRLSGVFHCAGAIRDSFIVAKRQGDIAAVFGPKVKGTENLDRATRKERLRFFLLFSSLSAVSGNAGQSDYAYANAFMDSFCDCRNSLCADDERSGITVSVNWPYWRDGGMKIGAADLEIYRESTGLSPLPTEIGLRIMKKTLSCRIEHAIPCYGDQVKFLRMLNGHTEERDKAPEYSGETSVTAHPDERESARTMPVESGEASGRISEGDLYGAALELSRATLGETLKTDPGSIAADAHFETLGIDSISTRIFSRLLEKKIGRVAATVLFECTTLGELASYLVKHHEDGLASLLRSRVHPQTPETAATNERVNAGTSNPIRPKDADKTRAHGPGVSASDESACARKSGDIAIVGMSCAFPKARDLDEFWKNLVEGVDCVTKIPRDRWDNDKYYSPDKSRSIEGRYYCEWGGFIDDPEAFDPLFFNISPKDARAMDPQERLLLLHSQMAIEDAGYNRDTLRSAHGSGNAEVGVFMGITTNDYQLIGSELMGKSDCIGRSLSWSAANRISYCLDLRGPSMPIDTACSSSLYAIHAACASIRRGECEGALAGAANLFLHPFKYVLNSHQRMLSQKGRCFAFSAKGDGFVPAEGVGVFFLKSMEKAIADGDNIHAVIKGSAVNHGGRTSGYTVPNPGAQAEVVGKAIEDAGVNPRTIGYVEAHGTGTILGDPIEVTGLAMAFGKYSEEKEFCSIGSVKANIGHAEAAAGIASLAKVVLQLKNARIVPALYADDPNPNIDFSATPFVLHAKDAAWDRPVLRENGKTVEYPRRAGISSFGAGGANAHIVAEEYVPEEKHRPRWPGRKHLFCLSAGSDTLLKDYAKSLVSRLIEGSAASKELGEDSLAHAAYTLACGRPLLKERLAVIASAKDELVKRLSSFVDGKRVDGVISMSRIDPHNGDAPERRSEAQDPESARLSRIAEEWISGIRVDLSILFSDESERKRVPLPTHPFNLKRYTLRGEIPMPRVRETGDDNRVSVVARDQEEVRVTSLTGEMNITGLDADFLIPLSVSACDYLGAHLLFGKAVLSGPTQIAMIAEAAYRAFATIRVEIRHMSFIEPIAVGNGDSLRLHLAIKGISNPESEFSFWSESPAGRVVHSMGVCARAGTVLAAEPCETRHCGLEEMHVGTFYGKLERLGYRFENSFKCIRDMQVNSGTALATIEGGPETGLAIVNGRERSTVMEPGIIDSCIQALLPTLPERVFEEKPESIYVPVYMSGFSLRKPLAGRLECHTKRISWDDSRETFLGSILITDSAGEPACRIEKFRLKRVDSKSLLA